MKDLEKFNSYFQELIVKDKYKAVEDMYVFVHKCMENQKPHLIEEFCEHVCKLDLSVGVFISILTATIKRSDISAARDKLLKNTKALIIKKSGKDAAARLLANVEV